MSFRKLSKLYPRFFNTSPCRYLEGFEESWNTSSRLGTRISIRCLNQVIQPMEEDFHTDITQEARNAYKQIYERYKEMLKLSHDGGGPKGIQRHVEKNKKILVRERIQMLIDPGTKFLELGELAGFNMYYGDIPAAGIVSGIGRVCGIYCMIGGNDATVKAGTYYPISVKKSLRTQEISEANRLPSIYIPDSGGAFLPLQSETFLPGGRSFYNQAIMSSKGIPQISIVCGSCTAGAAYNPTMSDEAIIIDRIGKIFLGGPPLVKAALGEVVSEEDLGGAFMHSSVSGCTDYYAKTEAEAYEMCRDTVESLNFQPIPPVLPFQKPIHDIKCWEDFGAKEHLSKTDLYVILGSILDGSQFKEFKAYYGPGLITGTGYIEGKIVGILANSDEIMSAEALKGTHFLDLCNRRNIPVIFLQNSLQKSSMDEDDSVILKDRGKLCTGVATLRVPKIALTLTNCSNEDLVLMCGPSFKPHFNFMWPTAKICLFDMNHVDEKHEESEEAVPMDSFQAAANMIIDSIISPENTRSTIGEILRILDQQTLNKDCSSYPNPMFRL